ncbi:MAG: exonuclease SbcCD subunit D [Fibrella sp.]|nr:exonuclease SbcCD subunit D [Armatimonadota bacterium]
MSAPAPSVRIMHFADVHLGVETLGKLNPETGLNTRLEDFTNTLNQAIDRALDANVDLALFAGDAYKARDPNQTHQRSFAAALKRLTDAGVPVVMLIGNHDIPNSRGRAHALEIYGLLGGPSSGVQIIAKPDMIAVETRKGTVLVAGMPYLVRSRVVSQDETKGKTVEEVAHLIRDKYAAYIADLARQVADAPDYIALLMGHFTVAEARVGWQNFLLNANEPQVPVEAITLYSPGGVSPWDYVGMGHVHKHQEMNRGNEPPVIYPGSIDRIDFNERGEEKGFVVADISKGQTKWKHVVLQTRRFVQVDADAGDADDPTAAILAELDRYPLLDSVVKVNYKVASDKAMLVRTDEIRKRLSAAHVVVSLQRDMPQGEGVIRVDGMTETMTPEVALGKYMDAQPRLMTRRDDLMTAARALFDQLAHEESLG